MKKIAIIGIIFILLVMNVVPVMAGSGSPNGHGNGSGVGQSNREENQNNNQEREQKTNQGSGKNKNQENNKWKYTPFYLQGVISGVNPLTVTVIHANAKVKQFIGSATPLTIAVNNATLYYKITQGDGSEGDSGDDNGERVPITLGELAVGQKVAIHGRLIDTAYTARLITVYIRDVSE